MPSGALAGDELHRLGAGGGVAELAAEALGTLPKVDVPHQLRAVARSPFVGQRLTMLITTEHHRYLDALRPLIEAGDVTPISDRTYPLAQARQAMAHLEAGRVRGKVAITI